MYPLVADADKREVVDEGGKGVYGKSLYHPLNFSVNLKLLLKNGL